MNPPHPPKLTGGPPLVVAKREIVTFDCPKCGQSLDITGVAVGASIECTGCQNVTWAPEYIPRWWYRTRNFGISVVTAFSIGVGASLAATAILAAITHGAK